MLFKKDFRPEDANRLVDLFTKRNLWALAALLYAVRQIGNDALLLAFQSNILSATKLQQYHKGGGGFSRGTYYLPPVCMEREQWACLRRKASDVIKGKTAINRGSDVDQPRNLAKSVTVE